MVSGYGVCGKCMFRDSGIQRWFKSWAHIYIGLVSCGGVHHRLDITVRSVGTAIAGFSIVSWMRIMSLAESCCCEPSTGGESHATFSPRDTWGTPPRDRRSSPPNCKPFAHCIIRSYPGWLVSVGSRQLKERL